MARNAPGNLRFEELCALAEAFGYVYRSTKGSHVIYRREKVGIMTFQNSGGKAKAYQVKQLLRKLEELGEIK